jgi:glycosyltransferase involved in cell wall biosynthesis
MAKISCVIHTYNSELYLEECLASVAWCDEIVLVDMHSADRTVSIAKKFGAKIFYHKNLGLADPARAFSLSKCRFDWVLAVDSDEVIPRALAERLRDAADKDEADLFYLSFRNFFFGHEIKGSGWSYRDLYVPRFFKKGALSYGAQIHNFIHVNPDAKIKKLIRHDLAVIHFNYNSVFHFIAKMNRYTDYESEKESNSGNPWLLIVYHGIRELFGRFIIKRGFLDGWLGLYLAMVMAVYRATSVAKRQLPDEKNAIEGYKKIAKETAILLREEKPAKKARNR